MEAIDFYIKVGDGYGKMEPIYGDLTSIKKMIEAGKRNEIDVGLKLKLFARAVMGYSAETVA